MESRPNLHFALLLTSLFAAGCNCGNDLFFGGGKHDGGGDGVEAPDAGDLPACAVASDEAVASPVDIIIVIDQSASMGQEISGVIDNINTRLVSALSASKVDYRVIVVSGDFCFQPPLSPSATAPGCYDSNLPSYFHVPAPVNSSDALTLLLWTYDGFYKTPNTCTKVARPEAKWSDKLRFDARKVFIVVSDDDPASFSYTAQGCTSTGWCSMWQCPTYADRAADWGGQDFASELYKLQPAGMFGTPAAPKWIFHSIVSVDRQYGPTEPLTAQSLVCNVNGNTGETSGVEYQKLSRLTGGTRFPTCDTDYSPVFQKIAATMVPLACEFSLASTQLGAIDPAKASVTLDPGDGGTPTVLPRDESAACAGANGWQFAHNFTRIVVCGAACDAVKASAHGKVKVSVGCDGRRRDGGENGEDDGGFVEGWPDGGETCIPTGGACQQVGGTACCFGLTCQQGPAGASCQSLIN